MGTGSSSSNRRLVVAFCITLYFWFAFFDDKEGLDPEEVGDFFLILMEKIRTYQHCNCRAVLSAD